MPTCMSTCIAVKYPVLLIIKLIYPQNATKYLSQLISVMPNFIFVPLGAYIYLFSAPGLA